MSTLFYISTAEPWFGEAIDDIRHPSNIDVWDDADLNAIGLARVVPFVTPESQRNVGLPSYEFADGVFNETYETEDLNPPVDETPIRRLVRKSVVIKRLQEAGALAGVIAILDMPENAYPKARWWAPDWPSVFFDDPEAVAIIVAAGADPEVIMAPGES